MRRPRFTPYSLLATLALPLFACAPRTGAATRAPATAARPVADVAEAPKNEPSGAPQGDPLAWATFDAATFARAKAERKFVLLDGAAEWCHWCHVMEATTYHDPRVRAALAKYFIATKVDVDARPDVEERYGEWGWPATVIFSPDGEEIGKYKGYVAPDAFLETLLAIATSPGEGASAAARAEADLEKAAPLSEETLAFVAAFATAELDEYYDETQGGWGRTQKAPVAMDNAFSLVRANRGDGARKKQVTFTLDQQRKLLDPVWGGIYQYSGASDWDHAHFEKLTTFQAGALDNYASAYALTKEPRFRQDAEGVRRYLETFMKSPAGGFYATQDADLNAHAAGKRYMTGHEYYAKTDAERRALGFPRIDTHEYGRENGMVIAALVTFYEATADASALASARTAAARIEATHASKRGGITHDAAPSEGEAKVLYLGDNAAFGLALMRLYDATRDPDYLARATRIAQFLLRDLEDTAHGGFFGATPDPDAVGAFRVRRRPYDENVTAVRFLARVARATTTPAPAYRRAIAHALRPLASAAAIKARGRNLGDLLLALDETRDVR